MDACRCIPEGVERYNNSHNLGCPDCKLDLARNDGYFNNCFQGASSLDSKLRWLSIMHA